MNTILQIALILLSISAACKVLDLWAEIQGIKDRKEDDRRHYEAYGRRKKRN